MAILGKSNFIRRLLEAFSCSTEERAFKFAGSMLREGQLFPQTNIARIVPVIVRITMKKTENEENEIRVTTWMRCKKQRSVATLNSPDWKTKSTCWQTELRVIRFAIKYQSPVWVEWRSATWLHDWCIIDYQRTLIAIDRRDGSRCRFGR